MKDDPDEFEEITTTLAEIAAPMLAVNVDFNMLLADYTLGPALDIVAKLKDLLS